MQKERGVVISNPFKPNYLFWPKEKYCNRVEELLDYRQRRVASGVRLEGLLSGKDIIKYLVYWDKIDLPNNNIISTALADDDLILLHDQGILTRTFCHMAGGNLDMGMMLEVQLQAFQVHDKENPGQWTLAQEIDDLYLPQNKTELKRVVEFNLFNTLPVPVSTTPIYEVLEFKDKRKDELLQLRGHLDDIYISIINAEESGKEYQKRIQEIHQDLHDLNRLFKENKIRTRFDSLKSYFREDILEDLGLFSLPSSIAGMASQISSLAPYVPSINIQMAAGAILAFSRKQIRAPIMVSPLNTNPFAYTFQMGREFRK